MSLSVDVVPEDEMDRLDVDGCSCMELKRFGDRVLVLLDAPLVKRRLLEILAHLGDDDSTVVTWIDVDVPFDLEIGLRGADLDVYRFWFSDDEERAAFLKKEQQVDIPSWNCYRVCLFLLGYYRVLYERRELVPESFEVLSPSALYKVVDSVIEVDYRKFSEWLARIPLLLFSEALVADDSWLNHDEVEYAASLLEQSVVLNVDEVDG